MCVPPLHYPGSKITIGCTFFNMLACTKGSLYVLPHLTLNAWWYCCLIWDFFRNCFFLNHPQGGSGTHLTPTSMTLESGPCSRQGHTVVFPGFGFWEGKRSACKMVLEKVHLSASPAGSKNIHVTVRKENKEATKQPQKSELGRGRTPCRSLVFGYIPWRGPTSLPLDSAWHLRALPVQSLLSLYQLWLACYLQQWIFNNVYWKLEAKGTKY